MKLRRTILGFFTFFVLITSTFAQLAYSDGLFEENLPPATIGDRNLSLYTKISPSILTAESKENSFLQLRLFDTKTGNNVQNVNYFVTVTKADKVLMRELFFSGQGPLTIKMIPNSGKVTVVGSTEPFLGGWTSNTGQISVKGPILIDGGLYHITIEIFGIDNPRHIFAPEEAPRFDSYLSIGDIYSENISHRSTNYNSTLISYYDKIKDFNFNEHSLEATWEMPFNWDLARIKSNNIFVHEELKMPKSFKEFIQDGTFNASVNNQPIVGRDLAIDPFSSKNALVIHFLLNKNDIIKLAQNKEVLLDSNNTMNFAIRPSNMTLMTSTNITTDTGSIHATLVWSPSNPNSLNPTKLKIWFTDALNDKPITGDVNYNLIVKSETGKEIIKEQNIKAENGTSYQNIMFPSKGTYQIELDLKSIRNPNQPSPDTSRAGIARGVVVVS